MSRHPPKKATVRSKPRISVNKLSEYLTATPSRRRAIVKEQKYPPTYRAIWYEAATKAIVKFLCDKGRDEEQLIKVMERLYTQKAANESEQIKFKTNAEALDAFLDAYNQLELGDGRIREGPSDAPKLVIAEVELSVRPEIYLEATLKDKAAAGAVKLYFSKDNELDDTTAPYIAALVERFIADHSGRDASRRHCQVFDVFGKTVVSGPASTKTRMRDIEAACEEIRLHWQAM